MTNAQTTVVRALHRDDATRQGTHSHRSRLIVNRNENHNPDGSRQAWLGTRPWGKRTTTFSHATIEGEFKKMPLEQNKKCSSNVAVVLHPRIF
jgi:hypothetical protein